ncbi:MAG: hypothetical protein VX424_01370 [Actinomycetota bacterium]|nr:hypothetical protein [Actinomycetota bacterium]
MKLALAPRWGRQALRVMPIRRWWAYGRLLWGLLVAHLELNQRHSGQRHLEGRQE